jgi:multisubunit Na+/H+ antiporter MnhB subunit
MIAVIMIVIGGIRYTTSNGDSSQVKSAKDTIMYAVIGLVVAILAYAIVNFILSAFK